MLFFHLVLQGLLKLAGTWFGIAYLTLLGFCFGMGLYRAYLAKTLTTPLWILCGWTVPAFLFADFICNTFCGTLLLLELPQWTLHPLTDSEVLLTARLSRWEKSDSWRGAVARWICHNLLDPLSPNGPHCH